MLLGNYNHSLDSKNRISLPSKIRTNFDDTVMVSLSVDGCLEVRTKEEYKIYSDYLCSLGNMNSDYRQIQRFVNGNTFEINIDNANRILIPNNLMERANIKKDVVLIGVNNKLEIWDKNIYNTKFDESVEDIFNLMNKVSYDK